MLICNVGELNFATKETDAENSGMTALRGPSSLDLTVTFVLEVEGSCFTTAAELRKNVHEECKQHLTTSMCVLALVLPATHIMGKAYQPRVHMQRLICCLHTRNCILQNNS